MNIDRATASLSRMKHRTQPSGPPVRSSELLCREIHAHIVSRAEWWRTNPDDSHGINTAVYVAMLEVANAINSALVFKELDRELSQQEVRQEMADAMDCSNDPTATTHVTSGKRHNGQAQRPLADSDAGRKGKRE